MAIVVLLGLFVADFWFTTRSLSNETIMLLLSLIGALLGIDIMRERIPIELTIGEDRGDK